MRRTRHVRVELAARDDARRRSDLASLSDPVLVARSRDGDGAALEVLVARHEPAIARLARRLVRDPEDARDAAQEALARLVAQLPRFRGESSFATWAHRVAVNACIDHGRRVSRLRASEVTDGAAVERGEAASPDEDAGDLSPALRESLAGLSEGQRGAVVLKDALSLPYDEVADLLALPIGTVKSHAHRGRRRLARSLRRIA
jgi:RNA polymerase sigma-70 factor (ECF subfamily)